jgi:hypothetical protein
MTGNKRPSEIMITSFKYQPLHSHICRNLKTDLLGDLLVPAGKKDKRSCG